MLQIVSIDLSNLRNKFYSQNYGFALTYIDAFSRYAWVEPMKDKTAEFNVLLKKEVVFLL